MKKFSNLDSLQEYIKDEVQDLIQNEIFYEVVEIMQETMEDVVYGWGEPIRYERRYHDGGLMDGRNININNIKRYKNGISAKITNDTTTYNSNWSYLDEIIEYGTSNDEDAPPWAKPRPFIKETKEEVERRKVVEKAIKRKFNIK